MKFFLSSILLLTFAVNPQHLFSQNLSEIQDTDTYPNFQNYLNFEVKLVDFENSLNINDFKTTEFQIENGFSYKTISLIDFSLGINGGVILGIPYEDQSVAYFQNLNNFPYDDFIKFEELDWISKDLSKTRYFIGFHPQLTFNISEKWKLLAGTELRYYFQAFFERRTFDGAYVIDEGVNFDFLGNAGLYYILNDHLSIGLNYNRGLSYLSNVQRGDPSGAGLFESSVRYHSLGLNVNYSF